MSLRDDLQRWYMNPGNVKARQLMRAAEQLGFVLRRTAGSHHIYRHEQARLTVNIPFNLKGTGTIRRIVRQLQEFEEEQRGR